MHDRTTNTLYFLSGLLTHKIVFLRKMKQNMETILMQFSQMDASLTFNLPLSATNTRSQAENQMF